MLKISKWVSMSVWTGVRLCKLFILPIISLGTEVYMVCSSALLVYKGTTTR